MRLTRHARIRMDQRAISPLVVDWLLSFGTSIHDKHGAEVIFFDKRSRKRLKKQVGRLAVRCLTRQLDAYPVAADGQVITVGHRTRRMHQH